MVRVREQRYQLIILLVLLKKISLLFFSFFMFIQHICVDSTLWRSRDTIDPTSSSYCILSCFISTIYANQNTKYQIHRQKYLLILYPFLFHIHNVNHLRYQNHLLILYLFLFHIHHIVPFTPFTPSQIPNIYTAQNTKYTIPNDKIDHPKFSSRRN